MSDNPEQRRVEHFELDDPEVEDLVQQRVPFTENLTESDLTDRDAEGEPEELTTGLPQEMPSVAPGGNASNVPATFYYNEETEESVPLPPRQPRARHGFPAPPSQSSSTSRYELPTPTGATCTTKSRSRPTKAKREDLLARDTEKDEDYPERSLPRPPRRRGGPRRHFPSALVSAPTSDPPAAAASSNPLGGQRVPTQAERADHRLKADQLEADLESSWHSKAAIGAAREEIERLRRVAAGGYINIAQPTSTPAVEAETDEAGWLPGEKDEYVKRRQRNERPTDAFGYFIDSEHERAEEEYEEEEEERPSPAKRQRRSRGGKKGGDGKCGDGGEE
ncbi:MAG: hypothetical protein Q9201_000567 [Fulgogasparrea decipioides]